jgi:hypothetical protein
MGGEVITLLTACAWIAWEPATNAEAHYFWEDNLPAIVAFEPEMEVCRPNGEWGVPHTYWVQGFHANGVGPMSDSLTVVWEKRNRGRKRGR